MTPCDKMSKSRLGMREPIPNPTEQRTRFLALAHQLRSGRPLSNTQANFLARSFEKIGRGESADVVFFLKRRPGQKVENEEHRQKMSLVFAQIAHYIAAPDEYPPGEGLSLTEAIERVVPLARAIFGDKEAEKYSIEYLYKIWHDASYAHMRTTLRTPFDPDSPLTFIPPNK